MCINSPHLSHPLKTRTGKMDTLLALGAVVFVARVIIEWMEARNEQGSQK